MSKPKEIVNATAEAILSSIPVVGGPLQAGLSTYSTNKKLRNIEQFQQDLSERVSTIENFFENKSNWAEDNLVDLLSIIFEEVEQTKNNDKRDFFVNATINILLSQGNKTFDSEAHFTKALIAIPRSYIIFLASYIELENFDDTTLIEHLELILPKTDATEKEIIYMDEAKDGALVMLQSYGFIKQVYDEAATDLLRRRHRHYKSLGDLHMEDDLTGSAWLNHNMPID